MDWSSCLNSQYFQELYLEQLGINCLPHKHNDDRAELWSQYLFGSLLLKVELRCGAGFSNHPLLPKSVLDISKHSLWLKSLFFYNLDFFIYEWWQDKQCCPWLQACLQLTCRHLYTIERMKCNLWIIVWNGRQL